MNKRPLGENTDSDVFYDALYWLSPLVNPNAGKIEPPVRAKRTGLLALADGTNWNPGGLGFGLYLWNGSSWVKQLGPSDTIANATNSDTVDNKHANDLIITTQVSAAPYPANPGTSRAIGSTYQNLTGKVLFVSVSLTSSTVVGVNAYSDTPSTPAVIVQSNSIPSAGFVVPLSFIVLPNYYYKVVVPTGTPTLNGWTEWY